MATGQLSCLPLFELTFIDVSWRGRCNESVVEKVLGKKYKISVELANSELKSVPGPVSQQSHLVRAAQALGARIVEERSKG